MSSITVSSNNLAISLTRLKANHGKEDQSSWREGS